MFFSYANIRNTKGKFKAPQSSELLYQFHFSHRLFAIYLDLTFVFHIFSQLIRKDMVTWSAVANVTWNLSLSSAK